jgi:hypothetical protein
MLRTLISRWLDLPVRKDFEVLWIEIKELRSELNSKLAEVHYTKGEEQLRNRSALDSFVWFSTVEANLQDAQIIRYLPLRIFFGDPVPPHKDKIVDALVSALSPFDFAFAYEERPVAGSWFQNIWMRTKALLSRKEVQDRMAKFEEALTAKYLGSEKAELGKKEVDAHAAIIAALKDTSQAVIDFGSFILVKNGDKLIIRRITNEEIQKIEENQALLRNPEKLLDVLDANGDPRNVIDEKPRIPGPDEKKT